MSEQEIDLGIGLPSVSDVVAGNIKMPTTQHGVLVDGAIAGALDSQLAECLSEFGINGLSSEELFQAGIEELNRSVLHTCRAGFAFWAAQESIKAAAGAQDDSDDEVVRRGALGTFIEWIEGAGLAKERVYEAIRIAKFFSRLPNAKRAQMLKLGKKPVLLLAKMPQEVIDQAAESGKDILDEAETMTYDQLRDLLKAAERRNQQLNAEVEHRDALINKFKQRDNRDYEFHWKTHTVREECLAYQAECEVALNSLQAVFNEQLNDMEVAEKDLRIEQLWVTANVIAARAAAVIGHIVQHVHHADLPHTITSKHMLTDDEAQRWLLDYPLIERKHEAAKAKREDARPNRPGRPSKKDK
ncbi:hypothetical protein [Methylomonas koyamae]|uniref:hypothetical protein n=1 Tax=Methylomonas koyamae TaxID=702114 RepID=UPI00112B3FF5|nr:hypothetical protein [Methylomonas koyamae]TPQ28964.1 hypothetical protein C2U68_03110 [Methylomonas koyamae]